MTEVPHSGEKYAAVMAASGGPNNDWLISQSINFTNDSFLSFWAQSITDQYGLERFRVAISTSGTNIEDFTIISEGDYLEAPITEWTFYGFDLSEYVNQTIHVAIQCISDDAFRFMLDDVAISLGSLPENISNGKGSNTKVTRVTQKKAK